MPLLIAFALGVMCLTARAEPVDPPWGYFPVNVPQCQKYTVPGLGTVCGYFDVENWKAVLRADIELTLARSQVDITARQAVAAREEATALRDALAIREAALAASQRSLELERANLKERDRMYRSELHRPRWGSWASWGLAIGATTAAVVLGAVVIAR